MSDKTQLVAMSLALRHNSLQSTFGDFPAIIANLLFIILIVITLIFGKNKNPANHLKNFRYVNKKHKKKKKFEETKFYFNLCDG